MKTCIFCLLAWFVIGSVALLFQGGHVPHWVKLSSGETVIAYTNGVVYTNSPKDGTITVGHHRTLYRAQDGRIMSSFPIVFCRIGYTCVTELADIRHVDVWNEAQKTLAKL